MKTKPYTMTVAEFKSMFYAYIKDAPDTDLITFGGGDLSFSRHKHRGDHIHQLEFNQVYAVTADPEVDG